MQQAGDSDEQMSVGVEELDFPRRDCLSLNAHSRAPLRQPVTSLPRCGS